MPARDLSAYDSQVARVRGLVEAMGPRELEQFTLTLSGPDLDLVERLTAERATTHWRAHPAAMGAKLTDGKFRRFKYVELLSQKYKDATEGRSKRQIWNLPGRYGKGLALDTPMWTPGGWTTMGSLSDGDVIFGGDGEPCLVVQAHAPRLLDCYRIRLHDGAELIADGDHLWAVRTLEYAEKVLDTRALAAHPYRYQLPPTPVTFRLPRKAARNERPRRPVAWVGIKSIERVPDQPTRCLTVDSPESTYLAGANLTVTHNTELLRWGMTWGLDRKGTARFIFVSYGDRLAMESAVAVRDWLRAYSEVLRTQLRADRQRADRFVTAEGGGVLAAGINASITGFGAGGGGGVILDDPFKNWAEAHSATRRDHVWNQYRGTLRNRLDDDDAFIIVCHHRVHEDDLTARLKEGSEDETGEEWEVVSLPALAIAGEVDLLDREPGQPLEPERFNLAAVEARRLGMGSYLFASLEQQHPAPEEGNDLLRAWFRLEEMLPVKPDECLTSWDLKLKDKEAGDFVVGQAWWRVAGGYWIMDQLRGGWDHATSANAIALMSVRHPEIRRHVIEAAGAADEIMPRLAAADRDYEVSDEVAKALGMNEDERAKVQALRRRGMSGLVPHTVKGDKAARARAWIAPVAEAGDVHLPSHASWVPHLLDELAAFPNGATDDQVDAMSQALQRLSKQGGSITAPSGSVPSGPVVSRPGSGSISRPGRVFRLG